MIYSSLNFINGDSLWTIGTNRPAAITSLHIATTRYWSTRVENTTTMWQVFGKHQQSRQEAATTNTLIATNETALDRYVSWNRKWIS